MQGSADVAVRDRKYRSATARAGSLQDSRDVPEHSPQLAALLGMQQTAGNAAVARMLQRDPTPADGSAQAGTPATAAAGPAPTIQITAVQQPPATGAQAAPPAGGQPAGAEAAPTGGTPAAPANGTTAPTGLPDAAPAGGGSGSGAHADPEPGPWQLQYNYQGQRQFLGHGQPPQDQMAQQVAVNLNIQQAAGFGGPVQPSVGVQGSFDPTTGQFTGIQAQAQVALVANVFRDVQAQLYVQGSAGTSADATGEHATAGVAGGAQISYNVNKNLQVFAQVQGGANTTEGQGGGPAYAGGAGVTWTFP